MRPCSAPPALCASGSSVLAVLPTFVGERRRLADRAALSARSVLTSPPVGFLLLTFLPSPSVDRLLAIHRNSLENEPLFLALALACASAGTVPHFGEHVLKLFVACRVAHMAAFLTQPPQPIRAMCFLGGVVCTAALALSVLTGAK